VTEAAWTAIGVETFLAWLNRERGTQYALREGEPLLAEDGDHRQEIGFRLLFEPGSDPAWAARRDEHTRALQAAGAPPLALWAPPGADLEPENMTAFVEQVAGAAAALAPGQRGQVEFPVTLTLKKLADDGSYVHVTGGLAPHWAKLTGRIFGQYELDTRAIHRLPEPESRVAELLDWVTLLGNGMKTGASSSFKGEDAWTIQRPAVGQYQAIIGAPPQADPSNGTAVRKLLRQGLREARSEMRDEDGTPKALLLLGLYRTMDEENALIALRSCDPALYSDFDLICLVADGQCKPLFGRGERLGGGEEAMH
jgi:hypothetical protein